MHVEVAQRFLPLGEGIGGRALLPARGAKFAELASSLERDGRVLRVVVVVFGVVLVRVTVGCCGGR